MQNENTRKTTSAILSIIVFGLMMIMILGSIAEAATITEEQKKKFRYLSGADHIRCITNESPFICKGKTNPKKVNYLGKPMWAVTHSTFTIYATKESGRNKSGYYMRNYKFRIIRSYSKP